MEPTLSLSGLFSPTLGDSAHPAVTLLHDATYDHRMWLPTILPLARDYFVVTPDLAGCGASPPLANDNAAGATMAAHAAAVLEALEALGVGFSVVVGSGFGAAVALGVADAAPARVAGVVLCDPVLTPMGAGAEIVSRGSLAGARGARAIGKGPASVLTDPFLARALRDRYARLDAGGLAGIADAVAALPADAAAAAAGLRVPVLVVAAEGPGLREAEAFATAAPGGRVVVVRDATPPVVLHRPERFVDALLQFFHELQARA